jgi:hypothetical protein
LKEKIIVRLFSVTGDRFKSRTSRLICLAIGGLVILTQSADAQIKPVPLPDLNIPGYKFPETEATIMGWVADLVNQFERDPGLVAASNTAANKIALHGWGLWTSLTSETDQILDGQKLRVFETWYTPADLTTPAVKGFSDMKTLARGRGRLESFRQLQHGRSFKLRNAKNAVAVSPSVDSIVGFVKYDPSAAEHIVSQKLLVQNTLTSLLADGANAIPPFTSSAVSLKPVFQVINKAHLKNGRYYPLPVWPGPPSPAKGYPSTEWPGVAWIDIQGGGSGKGDVDMNYKATPDGSTRTDATTYPVSSLINYKLSVAEAKDLNQANSQGPVAAEGDYAILKAMHVTTKEIARWTWQTFWWSPAPDVAVLPSSSEVVAARPEQLKGAPRNYLMSIGYTTELKTQPNVGGANIGESVYVYNPWLEAGFVPSDLPDSIPGYSGGNVVGNNFGVQTNCMSCHASANFNPNNVTTAPQYTGDRYIDLNDPRFRNVLTVDFLWSIPGNAQ